MMYFLPVFKFLVANGYEVLTIPLPRSINKLALSRRTLESITFS